MDPIHVAHCRLCSQVVYFQIHTGFALQILCLCPWASQVGIWAAEVFLCRIGCLYRGNTETWRESAHHGLLQTHSHHQTFKNGSQELGQPRCQWSTEPHSAHQSQWLLGLLFVLSDLHKLRWSGTGWVSGSELAPPELGLALSVLCPCYGEICFCVGWQRFSKTH